MSPFRYASALIVVAALLGCGGNTEKERVDDDDAPPPTSTPLLDRLNAIDGVVARQVGRYSDGSLVFDMTVRQLVDHDVADGPTFDQRVILRYAGRYDRPVVLLTDGYEIQYFDEAQYLYFTEPTLMFNATQIEVEHRFFGSSRPTPADWSKLTIAQAAADHHHIRELLGPIFEGQWLATGGSKSGMAALFYRYFYPDDVVATVAYVAPLMTGLGDERFTPKLATVGTPACREALTLLQRSALDDIPRDGAASRRSVMVQRFGDLMGAANLTRLGVDLGYEVAIINLPFTFWQYSNPALCNELPNADTPDDSFFAFLALVAPFSGLTNEAIGTFEAFRYQSRTQLGTPRANTLPIVDLLKHVDDTWPLILPDTPIPPFDPAPMQAVAQWAATASERVMLVYGEYDPWTAGAIDLGSGRATRSFTVAGGNHGSHIADLDGGERSEADVTLGAWTGLTVDTRYRNALTLEPPRRWELQSW